MTDEELISPPLGTPQIDRLLAIMHRLRSPGGCSWDAEQTHESLVSNLIEETYETVDAIQSGDTAHLKEELGDLLLQVVFHSELAEERGNFSFNDVALTISEKLVRRHPHVFARSQAETSEQVLAQWDEIKRQERGDEEKPYLHKTGAGLPSLLKAAKLQKKAAKVGFDWPDAEGILTKIDEELAEVREAIAAGHRDEIESEIGDLLFVVTNLSRKLGIDPEAATERTNQKFQDRFGHIETELKKQGKTLTEANLAEMELLWLQAKSQFASKQTPV